MYVPRWKNWKGGTGKWNNICELIKAQLLHVFRTLYFPCFIVKVQLLVLFALPSLSPVDFSNWVGMWRVWE